MNQTGTPAATTGLPMLGPYALMREIARSNDIVWEAVDPKMNRRVAVKELNLSPTLSGPARRDRIERFFREARAAGAMNHPNIVTIHEVGEDNGRYFIGMEYLEGQTLRERLNMVGALPLHEAVGIATGLSDALAFAHIRGVVHRDIKPENVHILNDGRVKLTDFGIARITHETQLTVAGQVFGTPSYMSPEQVLGREIDHRSDIFSLGVLLFEMVTGRRPFTVQGDSVVTITYRIMNDPTPPAVGVSPVLNGVIQRATAKAPADRFQTATEFGTALVVAGHNAAPANSIQQTQVYGQPTAQGTMSPSLTTPDSWARQQSPPMSPVTAYPPPVTQPQGPALSSNLPPVMPVMPGGGMNNQSASPSRAGMFAILAVVLVVVVGLGLYFGNQAFKSFERQTHSTDYLSSYDEARKLYQSGDLEKAAGIFRKIRLSGMADTNLVRRSADGEVFSYRKLGQQAQEQKDYVAAQRWFAEALKVSPDDPQAKAELEAVQKLIPTSGGTAPLGVPSDLPGASSTPPPSLAEVPLPGSVSTNDFTNANSKAAMEASQLLQQGTDAFHKGDATNARRLWLEAVGSGPGSQAALQAQDYVIRLNQGKDPFNTDGS